MKKLLAVLTLSALMLITGCGEKKKQEQTKEVIQVQGLVQPIYEQPVLITSVGQSADAQMIKALFERNAIEYKLAPLATPADLNEIKTLALVVGGSSKGLGAAGIDANQEAKRVQTLADAAKTAGIKIIVLHVGGEGRRGELTDRYIPIATANADSAIIVADGDKDQAFAKAMNSKPLDYATNIAEVGPLLKKSFK